MKFNIFTWLSFILFTYAIFTLWSTHEQLQHYSNPTTPEWDQTLITNFVSGKPISPLTWELEYELIEEILDESKLNDKRELLIDSQLADILTRATALLPKNLGSDELERAKLLTSKILPNKAGNQLASIFINYYYLQDRSNIKISEENNSPDIDSKFSIFKKNIVRENYYLGVNIANRLFGKKRSITEYLYGRRDISENNQLNSEQKKQQLNIIQIKYKNKIKGYVYSGQKDE
jgi:hypothetical protein